MELYKIQNEYLHALESMEYNEELTPEIISDTLSHLTDAFDTQVLNIASHIKNLEDEVLMMKAYESNMNKRRRRKEDKISALKIYIKQGMEAMQCKKIEGLEFTISTRACEEGRVLIDESILSKEFFDETVIAKPNLLRVRNALKDGTPIPGACFERTSTLIIK